MIGLDLNTSTKLPVIWITVECYDVVDLILDSIWIIVLMFVIVNFMHSELLFYTLHTFYSRINKANKHNIIISISSFQIGFNDLFNSTGFYFRSKVIECSHKKASMFFFNFLGTSSQNVHFWGCDIFLSSSNYPINSIFQYVFIRFMFLMKHFFS